MKNWAKEIKNGDPDQFELGNIWSTGDNLSLITADFIELLSKTDFDVIAGIETKGIIFASALSVTLKKPLIVFRKKDKIQYTSNILQVDFVNWKGSLDGIEIEKEQLGASRRVLVVDDITLTLSTFEAVRELFSRSSSKIVSYLCFANLSRKTELHGVKIFSLV